MPNDLANNFATALAKILGQLILLPLMVTLWYLDFGVMYLFLKIILLLIIFIVVAMITSFTLAIKIVVSIIIILAVVMMINQNIRHYIIYLLVIYPLPVDIRLQYWSSKLLPFNETPSGGSLHA